MILALRGHHLLCIQGFRGRGYSKAFVENFSNVVNTLQKHKDTIVEVITHPDIICKACPLLNDGICQREGLESELRAKASDNKVIERLGLGPGVTLPWSEILYKIKHHIKPEDLSDICNNCPWLHLGHCAEGINKLV